MEKKSLKETRKRAGFPRQAEVAELLGVSTTTLSNYETGKTSPGYMIAIKMAELYKVSIDELDFRMPKSTAKSSKEVD